jgi:Fe-Mn family superoxide dismutase
MLNRRDLLISAAGTAATLFLNHRTYAQAGAGFKLPALPYAYDALEPHIDAETMTIHHTKHHQTYIDRLNATLSPAASEWLSRPIEDLVANYNKLPEQIRTAVRNNGGGHLNHSLFWTMMAPAGTGGAPTGKLLDAIKSSFGGIDGFQKEFLAKATGQFGSGWAWLIVGADKPLAVVGTANQDNPISDGKKAILGIDVWEHAYYLKFRNQRPAYVEAWFKVINWNRVAELYAQSGK